MTRIVSWHACADLQGCVQVTVVHAHLGGNAQARVAGPPRLLWAVSEQLRVRILDIPDAKAIPSACLSQSARLRAGDGGVRAHGGNAQGAGLQGAPQQPAVGRLCWGGGSCRRPCAGAHPGCECRRPDPAHLPGMACPFLGQSRGVSGETRAATAECGGLLTWLAWGEMPDRTVRQYMPPHRRHHQCCDRCQTLHHLCWAGAHPVWTWLALPICWAGGRNLSNTAAGHASTARIPSSDAAHLGPQAQWPQAVSPPVALKSLQGLSCDAMLAAAPANNDATALPAPVTATPRANRHTTGICIKTSGTCTGAVGLGGQHQPVSSCFCTLLHPTALTLPLLTLHNNKHLTLQQGFCSL